jgi:hypothetical protein
MMPEAEPEPYFKEILFGPVWRVVDVDGLNSGVPEGQEAQEVVANHKSDEPVSRTRSNDWDLETRERVETVAREHLGVHSRGADVDLRKVAHVLTLDLCT